MIKLTKLDEPQILKDNKKVWTSQYIEFVKSGKKISDDLRYRYRERSIKEQIIRETHNKCAYCESKVSHVCPGDVEHILPKHKDARPDLYVEWTNLTLSCEECNRPRKREYFNPSDPLVNPYEDNPDDHFIPVGPMIFNKPGDRKGYITNIILELNRSGLLERRIERLNSVKSLADRWGCEQNQTVKEVIEIELKKEATPEKEYSFVVKGFLKSIGIAV